MGKCTLCHDRLLEGGTPACTTACPTGALKLGTLDGDGPRGVPGFPDVGIRPAIRFLPLRGRAPDPAAEEAAAAAGVAAPEPWPAPERKVSLRSEWTLFAFTSLVILLVAWLGASLLGGPPVRPLPFLLAGGAGLALSTLHLGRKDRAWRAALNWRRSWLSREVLAVPLFLALAAAFLLLAPAQKSAGALAAAAGLVALACMDRVYVVMARERRSRGDDTAALLSAAFLAGVLAMQPWLVLPAALARLAAFAERLTLRREPARPGCVGPRLRSYRHWPRPAGDRRFHRRSGRPVARRGGCARRRADRPRPLLRLAGGDDAARPNGERPRESASGGARRDLGAARGDSPRRALTDYTTSFRSAARKPQNRGTVSTKIFSSGECTAVRVGPNEIMSIPGYFSPMRPHSRPAWMALTSGSRP